MLPCGGWQWLSVARELGAGRLAGECLARYEQHLRPASNRPWSETEDELLLAAFRQHGRNWKVERLPLLNSPSLPTVSQTHALHHVVSNRVSRKRIYMWQYAPGVLMFVPIFRSSCAICCNVNTGGGC